MRCRVQLERHTDKSVTVTLTPDEVVILNNALNEVCNGVDIDDDEFQNRLGHSRANVRKLLQEVSGLHHKHGGKQ
jgi:hypothetical protein